MSAAASIPVIVLLLAFGSLTVTPQSFQSNEVDDTNNRPVIGIVAQEVSDYLNGLYDNKYDSYIVASYVKFVEGAGGRVVPIWIGRNKTYYEDIMGKINGVLWPGGASSFDRSNGYADAAYEIYKIAKAMNDGGTHFPILGICLGFELLTFVTADRVKHRRVCDSEKQRVPLEFQPNYGRSRLFGSAPSDVLDILASKNVTANYHRFCVTKQGLKTVGVNNKFRVMSLNRALDGVEFISSLESVDYPFYGLQFHPEKNVYEWVTGKRIPHSKEAVRASQYFADFFVNEARKNRNAFESKDEESRKLIYNYPISYTGLKGSAYMQCYLFKGQRK